MDCIKKVRGVLVEELMMLKMKSLLEERKRRVRKKTYLHLRNI